MSQKQIPSIFEVQQITTVFGEAVSVGLADKIVVVNASVAEQLALQLIVAANRARERAIEPATLPLPLLEAFSLEEVGT